MNTSENRPPLPPFTRETAAEKVRLAENGWNTRNRKKSRSPIRSTVGGEPLRIHPGAAGRHRVLTRKWKKELEYRLIKELWAFDGDRIAVRFAYEWHDSSGAWFRAYGNENWEFGVDGLMHHRHASINDVPIKESERKYHSDISGPRPLDHPGLSDLGL